MRKFKNQNHTGLSISALLALVFSFLVFNVAHAEQTVTYFHSDALGSVVAASDQSGSLL